MTRGLNNGVVYLYGIDSTSREKVTWGVVRDRERFPHTIPFPFLIYSFQAR